MDIQTNQECTVQEYANKIDIDKRIKIDLDRCDQLMKQYDSGLILDRIFIQAPFFYKYEEWYQYYYSSYSDAYLKGWKYNCGDCLYDYVVVKICSNVLIYISCLVFLMKLFLLFCCFEYYLNNILGLEVYEVKPEQRYKFKLKWQD